MTSGGLLLTRYVSPSFASAVVAIVALLSGVAESYYPNKPGGYFLSADMDYLVHDQFAPCEGPSTEWSCIRWVSQEEFAQRDRQRKFGFREEDEPENNRPLHQEDTYEYDFRMSQVSYPVELLKRRPVAFISSLLPSHTASGPSLFSSVDLTYVLSLLFSWFYKCVCITPVDVTSFSLNLSFSLLTCHVPFYISHGT